jgi:hypothetical protein
MLGAGAGLPGHWMIAVDTVVLSGIIRPAGSGKEWSRRRTSVYPDGPGGPLGPQVSSSVVSNWSS